MSSSERFPIEAKPGWSTLIAVCTKCEDGKADLADRVKGYLKEHKHTDLRALRSSCLDVCPKKGVCVAAVGPNGRKVAIFDKKADAESVLSYLTLNG